MKITLKIFYLEHMLLDIYLTLERSLTFPLFIFAVYSKTQYDFRYLLVMHPILLFLVRHYVVRVTRPLFDIDKQTYIMLP